MQSSISSWRSGLFGHIFKTILKFEDHNFIAVLAKVMSSLLIRLIFFFS